MNESKAICGWINTKTGESGKFDKNSKPVKYNLWDRIKLWWMLRKSKISQRTPSNFVYSGAVEMNKLHNGVYMGEKILSIYVDHTLELAKTQSGHFIDYHTWQQYKRISWVD